MRGTRWVVVLAAVAWTVAWAAAPGRAAAQGGAERVLSYDVDLVVASSGDLLVHERIEYDFGTAERRGIFRDLVLRLHFDDTYDRVYRLSSVAVTASPGTPADVAVQSIPGGRRIRIGDPDRTITGRHVYDIDYRIEGAFNGFASHDEIYWNAIGPGWSVPVERAVVRVSAPAAIQRAACFAGNTGSSLPCSGSAIEGTTATFGPDRLDPGAAFTVVAALPKGVVADTSPILEARWSLDRAFSRTPGTVGGALVIVAAGALLIGRLLWRNGRDRRWAGSFVDATFGNVDGRVEAVPLGGDHPVPVEYQPPERLRPGQVGTLVDEQANPVDVTATIVDLAVRGHLRIEEIPKEGWFGKPDWRLVKLRGLGDDAPRYEQALLDGLFQGRAGGTVELSELRTRFARRMRRVQTALYEDAVANGWFPTRPDHVRIRWVIAGLAAAGLGVAATIALAARTTLGLVPLGLVVVGAALAIASRWMPHRTAGGTAVMRRALGFRRFIEESAEGDRAQFAERAHLFTEYLPYAIVFGATEKWAKAFEGLAAPPADTGWYVGTRPFSYGGFADSLDGFTVSTAGTLTSTPSGSGSSGFGGGGSAGGGGGGGGGGSW